MCVSPGTYMYGFHCCSCNLLFCTLNAFLLSSITDDTKADSVCKLDTKRRFSYQLQVAAFWEAYF